MASPRWALTPPTSCHLGGPLRTGVPLWLARPFRADRLSVVVTHGHHGSRLAGPSGTRGNPGNRGAGGLLRDARQTRVVGVKGSVIRDDHHVRVVAAQLSGLVRVDLHQGTGGED